MLRQHGRQSEVAGLRIGKLIGTGSFGRVYKGAPSLLLPPLEHSCPQTWLLPDCVPLISEQKARAMHGHNLHDNGEVHADSLRSLIYQLACCTPCDYSMALMEVNLLAELSLEVGMVA